MVLHKRYTFYWILLSLLPLSLFGQETPPSENGSGTIMLGTYYADKFVGRHTSSGDIFRQNQYTAAHRSIPLGTYLLVINHYTDMQVVVRVNDRCPVRGVLDMTKLAVHQLGIKGSRKVEVQFLSPEEGYQRWIVQDTLSMSEEEYYAYRDRSPSKRISPYPIRPGQSAPPKKQASKAAAAGKAGAAAGKDAGAGKDTGKHKPTAGADAKKAGAGVEVAEAEMEVHPESECDTVAGPVIVQSQPAVIIASNGRGAAVGSGNGSELDSDSEREQSIPLKDRLYDIELCTVSSHKAAMKEVDRLPKNLQEKVTLEYNQHSRQIRILLTLADSRSRAVRTQSMISEDFPESYLILHKK